MTALKFQLPDLLEWIETNTKLTRAVKHMETLREGLGPDIDFAVDFHARPSPSVAAILLREIEPFHLFFAEEVCPPENIRAMQRAAKRSTTPLATGERLIAAYGCTELIDLGIVDVLQPDIAHVGGVTALWKVAAAAEAAGIRMAPHACEGPIGGIASLQVDAAIPNFLIQEMVHGNPDRASLVTEPIERVVEGYVELTKKPGLGVELNDEVVQRLGYKHSGFPEVYRKDGSVGEN